jgi:hypothetical protein
MIMKIAHILKLLELLSEKTGEPLDAFGYKMISQAIDEPEIISPRYIEDLYRRVKREEKNGAEYTEASALKTRIMAKHLGFKDFIDLSRSLEQDLSPTLAACAGNWWSYVRANAGSSIYRAPVRMFEDKTRKLMRMDMKGKEREFSGRIEEKAGCISGFLESGTDKRLGLVFKIGDTRHIDVLQGVFCGMSTAGYPIAGRELLVREKSMEFEAMKWSTIDLNGLIEEKIRAYLSDFQQNCIVISPVKGFGLDDLVS